MKTLSKKALLGSLCAALALTGAAWAGEAAAPAAAPSSAPEAPPAVLKDHRIGYVTTALHWAVYQTDNVKNDCPKGFSPNGPRETFKALYPDGGPVVGTQLAREALRAFPEDKKAQFPYIFREGKISYGMNLDGKVGKNDFTSPTGEKGIDNQLFRVLGCNAHFHQPEGQLQLFGNKLISNFAFDRMMIEITNVDNLQNADNVEVTIYRGRDPLVLDATGEKVAPGGTERVDMRYAKPLIQHLHGRIKDGVLTTDPVKEGKWPWAIYFDTPAVLDIKDMRFQLKLTDSSADGMIAGYTDVNSYYRWLTSWSTHHLSYGQLDPAEFYWALRSKADAYPDGKGQMTAISSAININMAQVFIVHPDEKVADEAGQQTASAAR
jgi:hypothetical protein